MSGHMIRPSESVRFDPTLVKTPALPARNQLTAEGTRQHPVGGSLHAVARPNQHQPVAHLRGWQSSSQGRSGAGVDTSSVHRRCPPPLPHRAPTPRLAKTAFGTMPPTRIISYSWIALTRNDSSGWRPARAQFSACSSAGQRAAQLTAGRWATQLTAPKRRQSLRAPVIVPCAPSMPCSHTLIKQLRNIPTCQSGAQRHIVHLGRLDPREQVRQDA